MQLEEESEARLDIERQLVRITAEAQQFKSKYESEVVARTEEVEEIRRKYTIRIQESEEHIETLMVKVNALEKQKSRLQSEVEVLIIDLEKVGLIFLYDQYLLSLKFSIIFISISICKSNLQHCNNIAGLIVVKKLPTMWEWTCVCCFGNVEQGKPLLPKMQIDFKSSLMKFMEARFFWLIAKLFLMSLNAYVKYPLISFVDINRNCHFI